MSKPWLAGFAVSLLATGVGHAGEHNPFGSAPQVEYWTICQVRGVPMPGKTIPRGGGRRSHFSAVMKAPNVNQTDIGRAFGEFLKRRYGVEGATGECEGASSEVDAQKALEQLKAIDAKYNYGGERIDTGWQYGAPSPAPAAKKP